MFDGSSEMPGLSLSDTPDSFKGARVVADQGAITEILPSALVVIIPSRLISQLLWLWYNAGTWKYSKYLLRTEFENVDLFETLAFLQVGPSVNWVRFK